MRSAFGFELGVSRTRVARVTDDDSDVVMGDAPVADDVETLRLLVSHAANQAGEVDVIAFAHDDDLDAVAVDELRVAIAAAGIDAMLIPASVARLFAGTEDTGAAVAVGAARYALGRNTEP